MATYLFSLRSSLRATVRTSLTATVRIALTATACCLALCAAALPAQAGAVVNTDKTAYDYAVYWDDLGPIEKGSIAPGQTLELKPKAGIVELVGQHDNIYIHPDETVTIVNGILQAKP
ncbi:MAG: hypothetical protein AB7E47_04470 [Desulfovibrionaceae bacterium]